LKAGLIRVEIRENEQIDEKADCKEFAED